MVELVVRADDKRLEERTLLHADAGQLGLAGNQNRLVLLVRARMKTHSGRVDEALPLQDRLAVSTLLVDRE